MIRNRLFTGWHFMRWVRLGIGSYMLVYAIQQADLFSGIIGSLFLFQAVTNTGCCGMNGCASAPLKENAGHSDEMVFEEIK